MHTVHNIVYDFPLNIGVSSLQIRLSLTIADALNWVLSDIPINRKMTFKIASELELSIFEVYKTEKNREYETAQSVPREINFDGGEEDSLPCEFSVENTLPAWLTFDGLRHHLETYKINHKDDIEVERRELVKYVLDELQKKGGTPHEIITKVVNRAITKLKHGQNRAAFKSSPAHASNDGAAPPPAEDFIVIGPYGDAENMEFSWDEDGSLPLPWPGGAKFHNHMRSYIIYEYACVHYMHSTTLY